MDELIADFVVKCLDDDNGISEQAYNILVDMRAKTPGTPLGDKFLLILLHIDATDGRYYLKNKPW